MAVYISNQSESIDMNGANFKASTLLKNGRRYKVASSFVAATGEGAGKIKGLRVTLTETFSGQHLLPLCDAGVKKNPASARSTL